jgi:hypothetical protein
MDSLDTRQCTGNLAQACGGHTRLPASNQWEYRPELGHGTRLRVDLPILTDVSRQWSGAESTLCSNAVWMNPSTFGSAYR